MSDEQEVIEPSFEVTDLIQHALDQDYNKANKVFGDMMGVKVNDALEAESEFESDESGDEEEDEAEDEDEDVADEEEGDVYYDDEDYNYYDNDDDDYSEEGR